MRGTRVHPGLTALAAGLMLAHAAFAASAENGKRAFMKAGCWQCHGTVGQGADAFFAATAEVHGLTLVTRNEQDSGSVIEMRNRLGVTEGNVPLTRIWYRRFRANRV